MIRYFQVGEFEKALQSILHSGLTLDKHDMKMISDHYHDRITKALAVGDWPACRKLRRRMDSFREWCGSGFDARSLIPTVEIPCFYSGKILLVSYRGGVIEEKICLRSNDLNHRDILRNAENEVQDLGLWNTRVCELGGAHIEVGLDTIRVWGGSDDFGACDRRVAAELAASVYGGRQLFLEK